MKKLLLLSIIFLLPLSWAFASLPGKYEVIIPNIPPEAKSLDRVNIDEVFSFTCPHCFELSKKIPFLKKVFKDKVKITVRPIGWIGENPGRLYYIGLKKGRGHQVRNRIFSFVFDQNLVKQINQKDILRNIAILEGFSGDFDKLMESPEIVKQMKDSIALAKYAQIESTPTIIIEGSITVSHNIRNLCNVINALLKDPVEKPYEQYLKFEKKK